MFLVGAKVKVAQDSHIYYKKIFPSLSTRAFSWWLLMSTTLFTNGLEIVNFGINFMAAGYCQG